VQKSRINQITTQKNVNNNYTKNCTHTDRSKSDKTEAWISRLDVIWIKSTAPSASREHQQSADYHKLFCFDFYISSVKSRKLYFTQITSCVT